MIKITNVKVDEELIAQIKTWFFQAKDPPKQMWKEILHKLPGYIVKSGYFKDQPEFCYMSLMNRETHETHCFQK